MGLLDSIVKIFSPEDSSGIARNLGRNEICWCGSGKKYNRCHLEDDEKKMRAKNSYNCGKT